MLAAGEEASASDDSDVKASADAIHATLRCLGLAPYELSSIPHKFQHPLRDYLAYEISGAFGANAQRRAELFAAHQQAEITMRKLTASNEPNGEPVEALYY